MDARNYVRSCAYETFICFARLCERGDKFYAHNAYMKLLLDADESNNYSCEKHECLLYDIKKAMTGATNYAIKKRKLSKEDKKILTIYLQCIDDANTGEALLVICNEGKELLYKYR